MLDDLRARCGPISQRRPGVVCGAEPAVAKAILANEDSRYQEHSDFFHTSKGTFAPRSTQQEIGRVTRNLLRTHWTRQSKQLTTTVKAMIGTKSQWPDAGN